MMKPPSKRPSSTIKEPQKEEIIKRIPSTQKQEPVGSVKQSIKPNANIPKYKKQVDALSYANNIIQKAKQEEPLKHPMHKDEANDSLDFKSKKINYHQIQLQRAQKQILHSKTTEGTYHINKQQKQPNPTKNPAKLQIQNPPQDLYNMLKQYQVREKQLLSKVDQLQQQLFSIQKQSDKKYQTLTKQHKNCGKQIKKLSDCIKQHQLQFNKFVGNNSVPYNNKREVILQTHIQKLKQYNKELTTRLKAYKGTQAEEIASSAVKIQVLNDYSKDKDIDYGMEKLTLQSLAFKISKQLQGYLMKKSKKNINFQQEQKYLISLVELLNQFGFECLVQGLRTNNEQHDLSDINQNLDMRVQSQKQYPPINDQYNKIIKRSAFNLNVISESEEILENIKPLISKLAKPSTLIFDCFRSSKKLPQIQQKLEETLGLNIRMLKNTNYIFLSILTTTLARYDILKNYVDNLARDIKKKIKKVSKPLEDLQNLYDYKDKNQQIFKQKITAFVTNNIQELCFKIPQLDKQFEEIPIRFSKLIDYI